MDGEVHTTIASVVLLRFSHHSLAGAGGQDYFFTHAYRST
jgi:hypothetical protein